MSRLNRKSTTNIEEPVPVAVTRAKRFFNTKRPVEQAVKLGAPVGIFYQQEVASYRLPRSLWNPSAAGSKQHAKGLKMPELIDNGIESAKKFIQNALNQLKMVNFQLEKLKEEDSEIYKGYVEGIQASPNISYKLWGKLLLDNGGLLQNQQAINDELKVINTFMASHSDNDWNVEIAKFIETEEDSGQQVTEKLQYLKKNQANAMRLRIANNELATQIKESQDADVEAVQANALREQELLDLVKNQQKQLNALIARHHEDEQRETKEQIAKRDEIAENALKASKLIKHSVRAAKQEVARDVTAYADTIVEPGEDDEEPDSG